MSDHQLRELERKWKASGAVTDEAELLAARLRAGDLAEERLDLAARCGSRAAKLALGEKDILQAPAHAARRVQRVLGHDQRRRHWCAKRPRESVRLL